MNKRLVALTLILAFPSAAILRADDKPPQAAGKPAHHEEETELGKAMESLNGAWRKLRKQVTDPASNAASLELLPTISTAAEKALTLEPAKAADVPAADREKFVAAYRAQMKKFIAELPALEAALKAGDNPAAQAVIQKIGALQKESHKEFKRPEK